MKILITGGCGFIGSNFIHYWLANHPQDSLVNLDKLTYAGHKESLKDIEKSPKYTFIHGDICDRSVVEGAMEGADGIIHFAAESHVDRSIGAPGVFINTNIIGTHTLLEVAREKNIARFHHISTDEVYGALPLEDPRKFSETTPYNPRSPYSASKAASDHLVGAYHATYGLPVVVTNCSNNFGPFQHPEKLIPLAITNILEGKKVPVYGDGLYIRDWLYVEDHCRAIDAVFSKGKIGETYCVGGMTDDINNLSVIKKIVALLGKEEDVIEYVTDRPGHDRRYAVDWSKIHGELGWQPLNNFDEWLVKTVSWYKENEWWWKPLKNH